MRDVSFGLSVAEKKENGLLQSFSKMRAWFRRAQFPQKCEFLIPTDTKLDFPNTIANPIVST